MNRDQRIPGYPLDDELKAKIPVIIQTLKKEGLDFYDLVIEKYDYEEMAEICSYTGYPVRYPHYTFGQEYETFTFGTEWGMQKVFELVVNNNPTYLYLLESNSLVDNITVVAHAAAHADFFKNNIFFSHTNRNSMNTLANHASRIRRCMKLFGKDAVTETIDWGLALQNLIDPATPWKPRKIKQIKLEDHLPAEEPDLLKIPENKEYLARFVNPKEFVEKQRERLDSQRKRKESRIPPEPVTEVFGFLIDHAPLKQWQRDVLTMLHDEAKFFYPQRQTKILNEGWASYWDSHIMAKECFAGNEGIIEYAKHKTSVLGGKYSTNPYKLGYLLFLDIEERWNKGQFGSEWEQCKDMDEKKKWDKKLGLGREKIFEVRQFYSDTMFVNEFLTQDFVDKHKFYIWEHNPETGEYVIKSRDAEEIKENLMRQISNGGSPQIEIWDARYRNKNYLLLRHLWDGRPLHHKYAIETLKLIYNMWQAPVGIRTRDPERETRSLTIHTLDGEKVNVLHTPKHKELVDSIK